jgi:hypothetical protein
MSDTMVVISRAGGFTHPDHERVYVQGGPVIWTATTDRNQAAIVTQDHARGLLRRGRWHGLDPRIEVLNYARKS